MVARLRAEVTGHGPRRARVSRATRCSSAPTSTRRSLPASRATLPPGRHTPAGETGTRRPDRRLPRQAARRSTATTSSRSGPSTSRVVRPAPSAGTWPVSAPRVCPASERRRARPRWLIACFSSRRHLGEGAPVALVGHEHRVVAEPGGTPRLGDDPSLHGAPCHQSRLPSAPARARPAHTEPGPSAGVCSAGSRRATPTATRRCRHRRRPPRRTGPTAHPGAPSRPSTSRPESSARAALRRWRARDRLGLEPGVALEVGCVLDHLGHVRRDAGATRRDGHRTAPASTSASSAALAGLAEARTIRSGSGSHGLTAADRAGLHLDGHVLALEVVDLADPLLRQPQQRVQLGSAERLGLGGALHLDESTVAGHHHVHVGVGGGVLRVRAGRGAALRRSHRPRPRPAGR